MATVNTSSIGLSGHAQIGLPARQRALATPTLNVLIVPLLAFFWISFFLLQRMENFTIPGIGRLPMKPEDLAFCLLVVCSWRFIFMKKTLLFWLIAVYFLISPVVYLAYFIAGTFTVSYFPGIVVKDLGYYPLIAVKEIEFFYIAFLMYQYGSTHKALLKKLVDILIVANIVYGIYGILTGQVGYYGVGSITDSGSAISGGIYCLGTVWLDMRAADRDLLGPRRLYLALVAMGIACTLATISRTAVAGIATYVLCRIIFTGRKGIRLLVFLALASILVVCLWQWVAPELDVAGRLQSRFGQTQDAGSHRLAKWCDIALELHPLEWVFGRGKGYGNVITGSWILSVDSQYTRLLVECGFVGMLVLSGILAAMLRQISQNRAPPPLDVSLFPYGVSLCVAMAVMCIPLEMLQVSKTGQLFWLQMFTLLGLSRCSIAAHSFTNP